jgi:hypothetical protein
MIIIIVITERMWGLADSSLMPSLHWGPLRGEGRLENVKWNSLDGKGGGMRSSYFIIY